MEHMLDVSRTRRQVVNQLVNMGLVEDRKILRKKRKKRERKTKKDDGFVVVSGYYWNSIWCYVSRLIQQTLASEKQNFTCSPIFRP